MEERFRRKIHHTVLFTMTSIHQAAVLGPAGIIHSITKVARFLIYCRDSAIIIYSHSQKRHSLSEGPDSADELDTTSSPSRARGSPLRVWATPRTELSRWTPRQATPGCARGDLLCHKLYKALELDLDGGAGGVERVTLLIMIDDALQ